MNNSKIISSIMESLQLVIEGKGLLDQKLVEEAITKFQQAVDLTPENVTALLYLALCHHFISYKPETRERKLIPEILYHTRETINILERVISQLESESEKLSDS